MGVQLNELCDRWMPDQIVTAGQAVVSMSSQALDLVPYFQGNSALAAAWSSPAGSAASQSATGVGDGIRRVSQSFESAGESMVRIGSRLVELKNIAIEARTAGQSGDGFYLNQDGTPKIPRAWQPAAWEFANPLIAGVMGVPHAALRAAWELNKSQTEAASVRAIAALQEAQQLDFQLRDSMNVAFDSSGQNTVGGARGWVDAELVRRNNPNDPVDELLNQTDEALASNDPTQLNGDGPGGGEGLYESLNRLTPEQLARYFALLTPAQVATIRGNMHQTNGVDPRTVSTTDSTPPDGIDALTDKINGGMEPGLAGDINYALGTTDPTGQTWWDKATPPPGTGAVTPITPVPLAPFGSTGVSLPGNGGPVPEATPTPTPTPDPVATTPEPVDTTPTPAETTSSSSDGSSGSSSGSSSESSSDTSNSSTGSASEAVRPDSSPDTSQSDSDGDGASTAAASETPAETPRETPEVETDTSSSSSGTGNTGSTDAGSPSAGDDATSGTTNSGVTDSGVTDSTTDTATSSSTSESDGSTDTGSSTQSGSDTTYDESGGDDGIREGNTIDDVLGR